MRSFPHFKLECEVSRISTLHDYEISKTLYLKNFQSLEISSLYKESKQEDKGLIVIPGYNIVEKLIFRFNSLDLPYLNSYEFRKRQSIHNNIDYAPLLTHKNFPEVFYLRLKHYEN